MTQESTKENKPEVIKAEIVSDEEVVLTFDDKARSLLTLSDYEDMSSYIDRKKPELALSTANSFFELFINGSDVDEIKGLNPAFPIAAINWCRIKYDWDRMLKEQIFKMQQRIADKVMKAQLEATSLYSDIISAANKKHSQNLKKYIQTGDESYLKKTIDITSVHQLQKVVDGLMKITNQDKNFVIKEEKNVNINVGVTPGADLTPETATKILAAIAEESRKKDLKNQKG